MLSLHDRLLLKDLRRQPLGLLWFYLVLGAAAVGVGWVGTRGSADGLLCAGGGFLVALGAEKLVTRRIRNAAARLAQELDADSSAP